SAARFGKTAMVEAMLDAFVDFRGRYDDIDTKDQVGLLRGKSFAATSDDDDDEDELRANTPESDDELPLLDDVLREAGDTSALHLAASQGHFEVYDAFATALVQLDLPMNERMKLLDARDGRQRPALWRAIAMKRLD